MFRYQWRAFWRRALRTGRVKFYLTVLTVVGWMTAVSLPAVLSRAAGELAAGQTTSMYRLLLGLCLMWLFVLGEDLNVSLSSDRLRRFPVDARSLLTLTLLSRFLSPLAWLATIVSLVGLSPLLSARHPLLGILSAVFVLALTIAVGMIASQTFGRWRGSRRARRATSIARLPGRLGPLVQKEQRAVSSVLDVWMVLLMSLAAAAIAFFAAFSSTSRQATFVIVCAMNANVTLNCLGLDRPAALTRYFILPIRGKDLFLTKNVAVAVFVAVQLMLLLAIGAFQSGVIQLGRDILVALVLVLSHLAWGNLVSVYEPRRTEPYRFASSADPVTMLVTMLIGSAPGVAVMLLLRSDSRMAPLAIAGIVLLTMAAYYGSLRFAGESFERRIEIISGRLA
ncbi:MAG TPA: hypothetical protein VH436_28190 [Vicinamibacterales bacterium]